MKKFLFIGSVIWSFAGACFAGEYQDFDYTSEEIYPDTVEITPDTIELNHNPIRSIAAQDDQETDGKVQFWILDE